MYYIGLGLTFRDLRLQIIGGYGYYLKSLIITHFPYQPIDDER